MVFNKLSARVVAALMMFFNVQSHAGDRQVLLLGTFHFDDAGLDQVKTSAMDVMQTEAQNYLQALAQRICAQGIQQVLLEYPPSRDAEMNARYKKYLNNEYDLPRNEIYQIGFRVARTCGLSAVHGFDEREAGWDSEAMFAYLKDKAPEKNAAFQATIKTFTERFNAMHAEMTLAEMLKAMNSDALDRDNMDLYLLTNYLGEDDGFAGADAAASWWRRNFRMYANIQKHAEKGGAVFALAGQGHTAILRKLLHIDRRLQPLEPAEVLDE